MIGYLCMTLAASFLLRWLERRMDGSDTYELVQSDSLTMAAGTYNHSVRGSHFDERSKEHQKNVRLAKWARNQDRRGDR